MLRLALVLALLLALATAAAADLAIVVPTAATVWTAGRNATVRWVPLSDAQPLRNVSHRIDLMRGDPRALTLVVSAKKLAHEARGAVTLRLPASLKPGHDYVVRIGEFYSHAFTVAPAKHKAVATTNTTASTSSDTAQSSRDDSRAASRAAPLALAALVSATTAWAIR